MPLEQIRLQGGQVVDVTRRGAAGGQPVLYFHSPATSGEELQGAAESVAISRGLEILVLVRPSIAAPKGHRGFMAAVASTATQVVDVLELESVDILGWSGGAPYALVLCP